MIKRYGYHNPEDLPAGLSQLLAHNNRRNWLVPDVVIVPSMDYANWLTLQLAQRGRQNISANVQYYQPHGFINAWNDELIEEQATVSKPFMQFALFYMLPGWQQDHPAAELPLTYGNEAITPAQRFKLAGHLADAFDQYINYRPDWLNEWRKSPVDNNDGNEMKSWQSHLWHDLTQRYPAVGESTALWQVSRERWANGAEKWPKNIFMVGMASLSESSARWFGRFSSLSGTTLHTLEWQLPEPEKPAKQKHLFEDSDEYTVKQLKGIRINWHRQRMELDRLGRRFWGSAPDINKPTNQNGSGLLHQLQLALQKPDQADIHDENPFDSTLHIHAAHNAMREAEILHEQLLECFEQQPSLRPDDILVVTPDLETYGPAVKAVFSESSGDDLPIPIHLADPTHQPRYELAELLIQILETAHDRFKITELLDLLSHPAIRSARQLSLSDLEQIEEWLTELNTRWGYDANHRRKVLQVQKEVFGDPEDGHSYSDQNSWMQTIDRLWMGFATRFQDETLPHDILPFTGAEGSGDQRLLGILHTFVDELWQLHQFSGQLHSPKKWLGKLIDITQQWIHTGRNKQPHKQWLMEQLSSLQQELDLFERHDSGLSYQIMVETLQQHLLQNRYGVTRIAGSTAISSMVPMRGIPYDVIALVGLNEDSFPGKETHSPFDIMQHDPRPGDRSRRREDRQLFLDYLLAARERLIITYTGKNERTDEDIPPSTLVTELLSLCSGAEGNDDTSLHTDHPLHSFREQNATYLPTKVNLAEQAHQKDKKEEQQITALAGLTHPVDWHFWSETGSGEIHISLNQLRQFFGHPIKYYCRHHLGIWLRSNELADTDEEPFQIESLPKYALYSQVLKQLLTDPEFKPEPDVFHQSGILPHDYLGAQTWQSTYRDLESQCNTIMESAEIGQLQDPSAIDITLNIEDYVIHITGESELRADDHQFAIKTGGSVKAKDRLRAWISHLAMQVSGQPVSTQLWGGKKSVKREMNLAPINNREEAQSHLDLLVRGMLIGHTQPLALLPESSYEWSDTFLSNTNDAEQEALEKAAKTFFDKHAYKDYYNENDDEYYQYFFRSVNPYKQEAEKEKLVATARTIWGPIMEENDG